MLNAVWSRDQTGVRTSLVTTKLKIFWFWFWSPTIKEYSAQFKSIQPQSAAVSIFSARIQHAFSTHSAVSRFVRLKDR
jgi:hypothetical protein